MNKLFIIIVDPKVDVQAVELSLQNLGASYNFLTNHWYLSSSEEMSRIFETIRGALPENAEMLVQEVVLSSYWGRMDTNLWEWLRTIGGRVEYLDSDK